MRRKDERLEDSEAAWSRMKEREERNGDDNAILMVGKGSFLAFKDISKWK